MKDIEELYDYLTTMVFILKKESYPTEDMLIDKSHYVLMNDIVSRMIQHEDKDTWLMQEENKYGVKFPNRRRMIGLCGDMLELGLVSLASIFVRGNMIKIEDKDEKEKLISVLIEWPEIYSSANLREYNQEFYTQIQEMFEEKGINNNELKHAILSGKITKAMSTQNYEQALKIIQKYPEISLNELSFEVASQGFENSKTEKLEVFIEKVLSGEIKLDTYDMPYIIGIQKVLLVQSLNTGEEKEKLQVKRI